MSNIQARLVSAVEFMKHADKKEKMLNLSNKNILSYVVDQLGLDKSTYTAKYLKTRAAREDVLAKIGKQSIVLPVSTKAVSNESVTNPDAWGVLGRDDIKQLLSAEKLGPRLGQAVSRAVSMEKQSYLNIKIVSTDENGELVSGSMGRMPIDHLRHYYSECSPGITNATYDLKQVSQAMSANQETPVSRRSELAKMMYDVQKALYGHVSAPKVTEKAMKVLNSVPQDILIQYDRSLPDSNQGAVDIGNLKNNLVEKIIKGESNIGTILKTLADTASPKIDIDDYKQKHLPADDTTLQLLSTKFGFDNVEEFVSLMALQAPSDRIDFNGFIAKTENLHEIVSTAEQGSIAEIRDEGNLGFAADDKQSIFNNILTRKIKPQNTLTDNLKLVNDDLKFISNMLAREILQDPKTETERFVLLLNDDDLKTVLKLAPADTSSQEHKQISLLEDLLINKTVSSGYLMGKRFINPNTHDNVHHDVLSVVTKFGDSGKLFLLERAGLPSDAKILELIYQLAYLDTDININMNNGTKVKESEALRMAGDAAGRLIDAKYSEAVKNKLGINSAEPIDRFKYFVSNLEKLDSLIAQQNEAIQEVDAAEPIPSSLQQQSKALNQHLESLGEILDDLAEKHVTDPYTINVKLKEATENQIKKIIQKVETIEQGLRDEIKGLSADEKKLYQDTAKIAVEVREKKKEIDKKLEELQKPKGAANYSGSVKSNGISSDLSSSNIKDDLEEAMTEE